MSTAASFLHCEEVTASFWSIRPWGGSCPPLLLLFLLTLFNGANDASKGSMADGSNPGNSTVMPPTPCDGVGAPACISGNHRPQNASGTLILLRHGESLWNRENRFAGWTDVDLSAQGKAEAQTAGRALKAQGCSIDVAFTSVLTRAIRTLWITLDELGLMWIPVHRDWRLNERHFGALQGLNKAETARQYGETQVESWRRSYEDRPPALEWADPRHPRHDPRYQHLRPDQLPASDLP